MAMRLTDTTVRNKSFQHQHQQESNTLAVEAPNLVRKVKKHIEQDNCRCCRGASIMIRKSGGPAGPNHKRSNTPQPASSGILQNVIR